MKKFSKKLLVFLLVLLMLPTVTATGADLDTAKDRLILRGALDFESEIGDWLAIALAASGDADSLSEYAYFVNSRIAGEVARGDRVRTALLCRILGLGDEFVEATVEDGSLDRVSELIWRAVIAADMKSPRAAELASDLRSRELASGGYALSGDKPEPDLTAMAAVALHLCGEDTDGLFSVLSSLQTENGGFSYLGEENAESAAQVVIAMAICGVEDEDPRFVKNGNTVLDALDSFYLGAGYSHTSGTGENDRATVQAALAALARARGNIYVSGEVEVTPSAPAEGGGGGEAAAAIGIKPIALGATLLVAVMAYLVLALTHRLTKMRAAAMALTTLALAGFIGFSTIETPEQYYSKNPDPIEAGSEVVTISVTGGDEEILPKRYALRKGENALDLLLRVARYNGVRVEASGGYVRGIGGLYEFDRGEDSGWTVRLNGELLHVGADRIYPQHGDAVEWIYTEGGLLK